MAVRMFRGKESRRASGFAALAAGLLGMPAGAAAPPGASEESHQRWAVIEQYCFDCHNTTDWAGGTAFDIMSFDNLADEAQVWETTVRKLRAGFMPPPGTPDRPDQDTINGLVRFLETRLDATQAQPAPGRVPLRRLNQREYANAVRDLLAIEPDVAALLPADLRKEGFDNEATHLQVSPSYLDQY